MKVWEYGSMGVWEYGNEKQTLTISHSNTFRSSKSYRMITSQTQKVSHF